MEIRVEMLIHLLCTEYSEYSDPHLLPEQDRLNYSSQIKILGFTSLETRIDLCADRFH